MRKFYLILIVFLLSGCQSVKDGLTGQKQKNSDEFLIEKKNPLVLPPEFNKLPEPKTLSLEEKIREEEGVDLEKILTKKKGKTNSDSANTNSDESLEKSILEQIKKN